MNSRLFRIVLVGVCSAALCSSSETQVLKGSRVPSSDFQSLELGFSTTAVSQDLCVVLGQPVTLRGEFSLLGKVAPLVSVGGTPVYLTGPFVWGRSYSDMEGRVVTLTGTLGFYESPPAAAGDLAVARSPAHYYMEAKNARIQLVGIS